MANRVELEFHGRMVERGDEAVRSMARVLAERVPGAAYVAGWHGLSLEECVRGGGMSWSAGEAGRSKLLEGIDAGRVERLVRGADVGGSWGVFVCEHYWHARILLMYDEDSDELRAHLKIVAVVSEQDRGDELDDVIGEMATAAAECCRSFEVTSGSAHFAGDWLPIINGNRWHHACAASTVASYAWVVVVPAAAVERLDWEAYRSFGDEATTLLLEGSSAGSAILVAPCSPAVMSPDQLRRWRAVFRPVMAPIDVESHNRWLTQRPDCPPGIVIDDWQPM